MNKRVLVLSDLHCGHMLGLTPPHYHNHFREIQEVGWKFFTEGIRSLGNIDLCIVNGDAVDGPGSKESLQHLTTDVSTQQDIAIECLKFVEAKKYVFLRGTPFHVTSDFEIEDGIADYFNAEIHDERKIDVNGCIIHCRHTTGKGGTAYGSATSLQRSAVVQTLNDTISENIKANILIRSHIHEYGTVDRSLFTAITTPALQFKGTSYGRKCTGFYDYGFVYLDIESKNKFSFDKILLTETGGDFKKETITKI
jgi:hypothetical protein